VNQCLVVGSSQSTDVGLAAHRLHQLAGTFAFPLTRIRKVFPMFAFIWWMIIGLIAGALARFLVPGRQPMGIVLTMILGMIGSLVGGFISSLLFRYDPMQPTIHAAGLIMSTVGAVVVLLLYVAFTRPRVV
jgi:uncharacterized membrane protein YeaQ/YmgE (transglycosylase-associated protein family)